jgi:integrase
VTIDPFRGLAQPAGARSFRTVRMSHAAPTTAQTAPAVRKYGRGLNIEPYGVQPARPSQPVDGGRLANAIQRKSAPAPTTINDGISLYIPRTRELAGTCPTRLRSTPHKIATETDPFRPSTEEPSLGKWLVAYSNVGSGDEGAYEVHSRFIESLHEFPSPPEFVSPPGNDEPDAAPDEDNRDNQYRDDLPSNENVHRCHQLTGEIDVLYRPSSPGLLEDTVPAGVRWWREKSRECVKAKLESGEIERVWAKTLGWTLARFPDLIWPKVGVRPAPTRVSEVTPSVIRTLRDSPAYAAKTRSQYLQSLRHLLRYLGSPLAEDRHLWTLDARPARRRWLTKAQLRSLWSVCREDLDRFVVAAEAFNGLRRVEVLRLRVRDLDLALPSPSMVVCGKGRHGGKLREVPVSAHLYPVLVALSQGKPGDAALYPKGRTDLDTRLAALGRLVGVPVRVSSHDLRRTFGRLAFESGVTLVQLKALYGHESLDQTTHYIGADQVSPRSGLRRFESAMESPDESAPASLEIA